MKDPRPTSRFLAREYSDRQHTVEDDDAPAEQPRDTSQDGLRDTDGRTGRSAAEARIANQASWVDQQIRVAMAKGDFDDLPGAGKPIKDLGGSDPHWWVKKLIEREQITGVLPPALALRKEDAELDDRLAGLASRTEVQQAVEDFNARVIRARYTPVDGPPLVTMPRDVDTTLEEWADHRAARLAQQRARLAEAKAAEAEQAATTRSRRWWRRR